MFDPAYPPTGADIESPPLRAQFTGLKALIDAIVAISGAQVDGVSTLNPGEPAAALASTSGGVVHFSFSIPRGDEGLPGAPGPPFAGAAVDAVNTLNAGESATVGVSFDRVNVRFTFGIPRGATGEPGIQGIQGVPGPPMAAVVVDGVTPLAPGQNPSVSASFDGVSVHLSFAIPRGDDGATGPPGEVTGAQLAAAVGAALGGTSNNTNTVATLDTPFADPDAEALRLKLNELLLAARR